jgi:hypothetical protein
VNQSWLDPTDRKKLHRCLADGLGSVDVLARVARDAGLPIERIDLAQALDLVADELIDVAVRTGKLDALRREWRARAPALDKEWPRLLPWASQSGASVERAGQVWLSLQVHHAVKPDEIERALPRLPRPEATILASLVDRPELTAPGPEQWRLVADRLHDLGDFLRGTLRTDARLHVFGEAPLPVWLGLGFHLRKPAPIHAVAYQMDPAAGSWVAWPDEAANAHDSHDGATRPLFVESESALEGSVPVRSRDALVLVVSALSHPGLHDVLADRKTLLLPDDAPCVVLARAGFAGVSEREARLSPHQALRAADEVRDAVRRLRNRHGNAPLHVFYEGPSALAFFIGTRLDALGTVLLYNRRKDAGSSRSYDFAAELRS